MTWLEQILDQHRELESPASFWYWGALVSISAVVKDHVWINRADVYKLYPNIYVMLYAKSGLKKGPPISMAATLYRKVYGSHGLYKGRSSIQGILKDMGTAVSMPDGSVSRKSFAFICSSELSSSIVDDKAAMDILTDLYDRNYNEDDWRSLLKMESFSLKDPTVVMFVATNQSMADDFFLRKNITGGYFARTFVIHEKKRQQVNSLTQKLTNPPNHDENAKYLRELAKLRGEMKLDEVTIKRYDEWYHEFTAMSDTVEDDTGTLNRFGDSVLKVAALIALSRAPTLIITRDDLEQAILQCEKLVGNVRQTTMGQGKSSFAYQKKKIITVLLEREGHAISREQLVKRYWADAMASEWDEIMSSLQTAGIITLETLGNQIVFRMPEKMVEELKKHFEGKN